MPIYEKMGLFGIVPVVKIDHIEDAVPLANALCEGGLPIVEVTFRTQCAKEAIKNMCEACPEMLIGAGTILSKHQVDEALEAGASFLVSPGFNPEIVRYCLEKKVTIIPGCATPSDMEKAISFHLDVVKFFPAEANGGIASIKAMSAPYPQLSFMPTGGIHAQNVKTYLAFDKVLACGGSWMVNSELLEHKQFDEIKRLTKQAIQVMLNLEVAHISLPNSDEKTCESNTQKLANLFQQSIIEDTQANIVGSFEIMKNSGRGMHARICVSTSSIERAMFHLQRNNITFDLESATYDKKNKLASIFVEDEINGFAFQLVRK